MKMRVSLQFPIAVNALLLLSLGNNSRVTSERIAESSGCNAVIVRNIYKKLRDAGLISTSSGKGATTLTRDLEDISLWDIYAAVETAQTDEIFKIPPNVSDTCPVGSQLRRLLINHLDDSITALREEMSKVSLAMLTDELQRPV
jgi:DNA-binding IscR family transcriptional regulator